MSFEITKKEPCCGQTIFVCEEPEVGNEPQKCEEVCLPDRPLQDLLDRGTRPEPLHQSIRFLEKSPLRLASSDGNGETKKEVGPCWQGRMGDDECRQPEVMPYYPDGDERMNPIDPGMDPKDPPIETDPCMDPPEDPYELPRSL